MRPTTPISRVEFIILTALLMACSAYATDSMLTSLPKIGAELDPNAPHRARLILTVFFVGVGLGTFLAGPLSDAFGRRRILLWGLMIFAIGSALAWQADDLNLVLFGRFMSGIGAAAPRVLSGAIIRDQFQGREMVRISSFAMMIFTFVPGVAPLIGMVISDAWGWRAVFASIMIFALLVAVWFGFRQHETLALDNRRPLRLGRYKMAVVELAQSRSFVVAMFVQTLVSAMLYTILTSSQDIFAQVFDRAAQLPYFLGATALLGAFAAFTNARLVLRLGMRRLIRRALTLQVASSIALLGFLALGDLPKDILFAVFFVWMVLIFFILGFTTGNLQAIALGPFGHMAGMASSLLVASATLLAGLLSYPVAALFDGTLLPLVMGIGILGGTALTLSHWLSRAD